MMVKSPDQFAQLLPQAIRRISVQEDKQIQIVPTSLIPVAKALGLTQITTCKASKTL